MRSDVYEHLAKTFLDKKRRVGFNKKNLWILLILVVLLSFPLIYVLGNIFVKKNIFSRSLFVIQDAAPIVLGYDFSQLGNTKTRAISFNLNNVDLSSYNHLSLSIRTKEKTKIDSTIKVQIENSLLEKDAEYISGLNIDWQVFTLPLIKFEKIKDWTSVKALTFIVEEWNIENKKDQIYIDEVHFVTH